MDLARPRPSEIYERYYATRGARRVSGPFDPLWTALRRAKARRVLGAIPPRARVLDVGCERGELLHELELAGCEVKGTQISEAAARHARQHFGIEVFVGELEDAPFAADTFDAILMLNVLEHLPDPEAYVARIAGMLPPGGLFVVELPNVESPTARFAGKRWLHADAPHHFWGFSRRGLARLLARHGFRVERTIHWSTEFGPIGVAQSLLNYLPGPRNVLFELITDGAGPGIGRLARQGLHALLGALLLPPSFVLAGLESALRRGQVITAFARRG